MIVNMKGFFKRNIFGICSTKTDVHTQWHEKYNAFSQTAFTLRANYLTCPMLEYSTRSQMQLPSRLLTKFNKRGWNKRGEGKQNKLGQFLSQKWQFLSQKWQFLSQKWQFLSQKWQFLSQYDNFCLKMTIFLSQCLIIHLGYYFS